MSDMGKDAERAASGFEIERQMHKPEPPQYDPDNAYMTTVSGRRVFFHDPKPEDIDLGDIAYALSGLYRWGGHTEPRWSVAQHSILGSSIIEKEFALEFLLHDAAEAYLGDIIRPLKRMPEVAARYQIMEECLERVMAEKFGLLYPFPDEVKLTDNLVGYNEALHLMKSSHAGYCFETGRELDKRLTPYLRYEHPVIVAQLFVNRAIALIRERQG